jgi:malonyl-ACP decarboxylase
MDDGIIISSAAILHPAAETLSALDGLLRGGQCTLAACRLGGPAPVPAAIFGDFSVRGWLRRHPPRQPEAANRLIATAGRATLPTRTGTCVALGAAQAARLEQVPAERLAVLVAGNNLALGNQAVMVSAHADDDRGVRAGHLLDCFDTDAVGAISQVVGAHAEGWTVGAASASGTVCLIQGARLVATGAVDHCLVVAPVAELSGIEVAAFLASGAMASLALEPDPVSACRPFDSARRGFAYGQAAAAVVLERRAAAVERDISPLAQVLGYGQYLDGARGTEPNVAGQVRAAQAALRMAGLRPSDIDYVSAHATGSVKGDTAEASSLRTVFGIAKGPWINATKGLLGHGLGAAGLVEMIAAIVQMRGRYCHPNPWLDRPVLSGLRLVPRTAQRCAIRYALSNSYAFSGINTSVVIGADETSDNTDRLTYDREQS